MKHHMRYEIRWIRDIYPYDYAVLATNIKTLEEARSRRVTTGDLVFYVNTNTIVEDTAWLWDFEKDNPTSYARRQLLSFNHLVRHQVCQDPL